MKKQVAVARLWHEGNSFAPSLTTRAEFLRREWIKGPDCLARFRHTATEMGAVVAAAERPEAPWDISFLRCAAAPPGGALEAPLFREIVAEITDDLAARRWDGVYLSLHGACLSADEPEADLVLLRAVRRAIGQTPLAVTFDLHANLSPEVGELVDILVGYKTYPHVDMAETAGKALALLGKTIAGHLKPVVRLAKADALLTSFAMRTQEGPMAEIEAAAVRLGHAAGALDVTPFGGFAYGDTPAAGASVAVTLAGSSAQALDLAQQVAAEIKQRQARFSVRLPTAAQALQEALNHHGPVAVLEPGDNPLSGGAADTTGLLRALLEAKIEGPVAFTFFADPEIVQRALAAGVGAEIAVALGGRLCPEFGAPVYLKAEVARVTHGRFVNEGPMERGLAVDLGPSVVLRHHNLEIVVTQGAQAANDPAYFQLHGINIASLRLLCAKAKNHFRAAFAARFTKILECDTPGPACLDLSLLPFRRVPPALLEAWRQCAAASL